MKKPQVNKPCPCGSGKKYKKCCGHPSKARSDARPSAEAIAKVMDRMKARDIIRTQQQGLGRPIIATEFKGHMMVAVGSQLFAVPKGKTFPDFLMSYLPTVMGRDWFSAELALTINRHPLVEWYAAFRETQKRNPASEGQVASMPETGVTACYLGVAYNLYLLQHNVELQSRFIARLKDRNNFQGAYYELIVANCLIRAGFELVLEDEVDDSAKHCEFSALSKMTGKKYWVEAKARGVIGVLCKTSLNGTKNKDATSSLSAQLSAALKKPAADERLIFLDVNAPEISSEDSSWVIRAEKKLQAKERDRKPEDVAYVFITNMNFHFHLDGEKKLHGVLAYGFGISDFGKPGYYNFRELYRQKKKHADAHSVLETFRDYPKIPSTVDGSLPSESFSKSSQAIKIGETYDFDGIGVATVTTATVNESSGAVCFGTSCGKIITRQLNPAELEDYKKHRDTYFGVVYEQGKKADSPYEFFEHMVEIHLKHSEESILDKISLFPDAKVLRGLSHEERVLAYCEYLAASLPKKPDGKAGQ